MADLFSKYSTSEIIIFFVVFIIAIKELVEIFDFFKDKLKKLADKENEETTEQETITHIIERQDKMYNKIGELIEKVDGLIQSDKDDIKSWITKEHHKHCYDLHYIDDYSMDCIEKRYAHYVREGGNSFIESLMNEIRALPRNQ